MRNPLTPFQPVHSLREAIRQSFDYLGNHDAMDWNSWHPRYDVFKDSLFGWEDENNVDNNGVALQIALDRAFGAVGDFEPVEASKAFRASEIFWSMFNTGVNPEDTTKKKSLKDRFRIGTDEAFGK